MQVVFSSSEDLDSTDQQTSLIPTVEEVVREEDVQGEDAGSEQQFGVFKDFDFLDVELEDAEVRIESKSKRRVPPQSTRGRGKALNGGFSLLFGLPYRQMCEYFQTRGLECLCRWETRCLKLWP